ncbi:MAG: 4Fe-4S dicluster domain-containing protein [Thermoplasmata archaeon]|nr:MAG: 4Fe-4S dicluster domain-containing protein [Thermoplasmata archaeon]RLF49244.1 MAG: ferredoxin [Thermoplasmata archaeon]HDH81663.1 4Fe-4S dicluster domain-containing protein [Thermoplasmatales archaeon]
MKTTISYPTKAGMGKTGSWRVFRPVLHEDKCIKCWICWVFCPESAIERNEFPKIDYDFCKGCGVCANECPVNAIEMRREEK